MNYSPARRLRIAYRTLSLISALFIFQSAPILAQEIPQLGSPTTLTGATTTAQFAAGARVSGGSFATGFQFSESVQLDVLVTPESSHVGSSGKIYVLAIAGGAAFTLLESGEWTVFDGTVAGLGGAQSLTALSSANEVAVANLTQLFGQTGVIIENGVVAASIFIAYDTSANPNELYFSGAPLAITITNSDLVRNSNVPELAGATTASGAATTARFYGGAQVRGSDSFATSFQNTDDISIPLEINPEFRHLGTAGKGYVLAAVGGALFTLLESGEWQVFDGTVAGLGGAATYSSLRNIETLSGDTVVSLLTREGVTANDDQVTVIIYLAYDSSAAPGELYFTGAPLQISIAATNSTTSAIQIYEANVESQIVQARCIVCHVAGGAAGSSGLLLQRSSATSPAANFALFESFAAGQSDPVAYILSKASGGSAHGGGSQLAVGSADYNNLQAFLEALTNTAAGGSTTNTISFFSGVQIASPADTLRRAAIILAGRAPTEAEYQAVESGDDATLRSTIRGLMQGENFHKFLTDGANDQLLVRGLEDIDFLGTALYPNSVNEIYRLRKAEYESNNAPTEAFNLWRYNAGQALGFEEAPLELIAHVVENEKPYSEILTADYIMLNPIANYSVDGTGVYANSEDYTDFQPAKILRQYLPDRNTVEEEFAPAQLRFIVNPGTTFYEYPHSGVLNTQAFLWRYPTTATNRNRARARWTFLHFLDVDIERSAPRTTDPVALADTNNPTMFNSNCTVCHSNLDPVAGAFQNYGENGHYRVNGRDSLDEFYKYPDDGSTSPYQEGDIWYRDMREPGLLGQLASNNDTSVRWLAEEIVKQPGFARATVKFWWPSIMGADTLLQPEVQSDADYEARLLAFNEQSAYIDVFANNFRNSNLNLKDMLVDMVMSPWFRAAGMDSNSYDATQDLAHSIADLGTEKLLTPEQLSKKTESLTGYAWQNRYDLATNQVRSALENDYGLYYGGIDSNGLTQRATDMTALMSTVAVTHASESSCPIVIREFALEDGQRFLFNGVDEFTTPISEGAATKTFPTTFEKTPVELEVNLSLLAGPNQSFCLNQW